MKKREFIVATFNISGGYYVGSEEKELFPNPRLSFTTKSLNTYYTYDRGYMICEVELDNTRFRILNHHGFPYRRFHSTPEKNKNVFEFFDEVISQYHPDNDTSKNYKRTVNDVTTVDGMKFDDILVYKNNEASSKIVPLFSDHFLALACIEMKEDE